MKRMAIFRFFASCQAVEIDIFIDLVFSSFFDLFGKYLNVLTILFDTFYTFK